MNVKVTGVVQGVGYRYHVARRALDNGIRGWVKNRADGSVEVEAVGPKPKLEDFLSFVRVGPAGAHVAGVNVKWSDDDPSYEGFDIRF
jgi:acylphosphatase